MSDATPSHRPSKVAVRHDNHLDQSWRRPVFSQQVSWDRLEVIADLHGPELAEAVLPNLVGFTDGEFVGGHVAVVRVAC